MRNWRAHRNHQLAAPKRVEGVDSSPEYVAYARARVDDSRVAFRVADARSLPQENASANAAVFGLSLNFVPEPVLALREMLRVIRPATGVVAAYVWDYADRMEMTTGRHFWADRVRLPVMSRASLTSNDCDCATTSDPSCPFVRTVQ